MHRQIGKGEFRHAGLPLPQKFTRTAKLEIAFGDHEAVIRLAHHGKPGRGRLG